MKEDEKWQPSSTGTAERKRKKKRQKTTAGGTDVVQCFKPSLSTNPGVPLFVPMEAEVEVFPV